MGISMFACAVASQDAYEAVDYSVSGCEISYEERGEDILIAFRGTTFDGVDIIRDLRGLPRPSSDIGGLAHSGFLHGAVPLYKRLRAEVMLQQVNNRRIILTGHSKGGAEAVIFAALMCKDNSPPDGLVTFGAPRVLMGGLADEVSRIPGYRYVFANDIVPSVPTFPYFHDRDATILGPNGRSWWRRSIRDHRIRNYVEALESDFSPSI